MNIVIAYTEKAALDAINGMNAEPMEWLPIGAGGAIYSTPKRVRIRGPLVFDKKFWEWFTRSHIISAQEIEFI